MVKEFTIKSVELRNYNKKHLCHTLNVIGGDKLLVTISPPIPGFLYDRTDDLSDLILAPRYEGTKLVPEISEWPFYVNVCLPDESGDWENGPFHIIDIGLLEEKQD